MNRLGDALGALIDAVAASKQDFLVKAAERDGFIFEGGVFRPADTVPSSFAVTRVEDLATIDDRRRRLHLIANNSRSEAVGGAKEALEVVPIDIDNAKEGVDLVSACLHQLCAVVVRLDEVRNVDGLPNGRDGKRAPTPRHARLAVGAAVTFACFVAETCLERTALRTVDGDENGKRRRYR